MNKQLFKNFMQNHENYIVRELHDRLNKRVRSSYQDFFLHTAEGRQRLKIWVNLVINSTGGHSDTLFRDQEKIAYTRAVQGFNFEEVSHVYLYMQKILHEIMMDVGKKPHNDKFEDEYNELQENMFRGHHILATMFLRTREEIISEKMYHLESLHDFTREMIKSLELKDIIKNILVKSNSIFKMSRSYISLYKDHHLQGIFSHPAGEVDELFSFLMEKSYKEKKELLIDENGKVCKKMNFSKPSRIMAFPIKAHAHCYGVLAFQTKNKGYSLSSNEMDLLHQLLYIAAIAMENSYMFKEIELRQKELSFLAEKLITVQEEERRRLAADIHDSLAQALTGMGYKIQVCKELINRNPKLLAEQLDNLARIVDNATKQSRELMSSLRPDLLDDIGLVAALRKFMENFSRDTNIKIKSDLPKHIQMPPEIKICLFRVVQEALTNIYKHSGTKNAKISIKKAKANISLTVSDDGEGFKTESNSTRKTGENKIGLLSMKERIESVGGRLMINSAPGHGCRIKVAIPTR